MTQQIVEVGTSCVNLFTDGETALGETEVQIRLGLGKICRGFCRIRGRGISFLLRNSGRVTGLCIRGLRKDLYRRQRLIGLGLG